MSVEEKHANCANNIRHERLDRSRRAKEDPHPKIAHTNWHSITPPRRTSRAFVHTFTNFYGSGTKDVATTATSTRLARHQIH